MPRPLLVLTLVLGGLAAAYGALAVLDRLARSEGVTESIAPAAGRLRLDTGAGDIVAVAGSGPPRLEARSVGGLFGDTDAQVSRGPGGVVSVESDCRLPASLFSCGASLRVVVPAATPVELATDSGNVTVTGLRGGVVARTGSGDVELRDVGGRRVVMDTGSGNVRGTGLDSATVRAETGSGDVELDTARAPDDVVVDTGSGDVRMAVPDAGYRFTVDTGSGDERIDVRQDPASARRIRVRTGSGDIHVGSSPQR